MSVVKIMENKDAPAMPYVLKKNGMYYAHNSCGYVSRVLLAELYTEEHAKSYQKQSGGEVQAIPLVELLTGVEEVQNYIDRLIVMRDVLTALEAENE